MGSGASKESSRQESCYPDTQSDECEPKCDQFQSSLCEENIPQRVNQKNEKETALCTSSSLKALKHNFNRERLSHITYEGKIQNEPENMGCESDQNKKLLEFESKRDTSEIFQQDFSNTHSGIYMNCVCDGNDEDSIAKKDDKRNFNMVNDSDIGTSDDNTLNEITIDNSCGESEPCHQHCIVCTIDPTSQTHKYSMNVDNYIIPSNFDDINVNCNKEQIDNLYHVRDSRSNMSIITPESLSASMSSDDNETNTSNGNILQTSIQVQQIFCEKSTHNNGNENTVIVKETKGNAENRTVISNQEIVSVIKSDLVHQIHTNTSVNKALLDTRDNNQKLFVPQSSASCLDILDAEWEAFFTSNVSPLHSNKHISLFPSSSANNVPPSSTQYHRYRKRVLARGYTNESLTTSNDTPRAVYDTRSIYQAKTLFGDHEEKLNIEENILKQTKQTCDVQSNSERSNISKQSYSNTSEQRVKSNMLKHNNLSLSERSKLNSKQKYREYDFDIASRYLEDLQVTIKGRGYFKHFPTFEVLRNAQNILKNSKTLPPRNSSGVIIPYPYLILKGETKGLKVCDRSVNRKPDILKQSSTMEVGTKLQTVTVSDGDTETQKVRDVYISVVPHFDEFWKNFKSNQDMSEVGENDIYNDVVDSFVHLCRDNGLHCSAIEGLQKDCFCFNPQPSKWAAVVLESKWRLINPNAPLLSLMKNVIHEEDLPKHQLKEYYRKLYLFLIDFYFLTDPCEFIFTNIPEKLYWQLLCRSISRDEWENIQIMPFFFFYDLKFFSFSDKNLKLKTESCTITVQYPDEENLLFCATLFDSDKKSEMNASTFIENEIENHAVNIRSRVQTTGLYTLKLYCREQSFPFYVCVCNLRIHFTVPLSKEVVLYQTGLRRQWGPGHDTITSGLFPISHKYAIVDIENEFILIQFKLKPNLGLFFTLLDNQGQSYEKNILYWIDDNIVNIKVTSPGNGSYIFYIFSSDGKSSFKSIPSCSYLLNFKTYPCERFQNFQIPNRKLGITEDGRQRQCLLLSENTDYIYSSDCGILHIHLKVTDCCNCYPKLQLHGNRKSVDMQEYCSWFSNKGKVSCTINFPKLGDYLFTLASKSDHGDIHLYFVLVHVTIPSAVWSPFPKRLLHHTEVTVRVIEPHAGIIPAKTDIYFILELICECDVAIVTSKGWFHLNQTSANYWEGNVTTGVKGTDVTVVARFEVGSDKFTSLLVYKVVTADEIQRKNEYQRKYRDNALSLSKRYDDVRNDTS